MKSKFARETCIKIVGAIKAGISRRDAAEAHGWSRWTMNRNLARGEADLQAGRKTRFAKFYSDVLAAEASSLGGIEHALHAEAKQGDVRAQLAILAAKRPEIWSPEARNQQLVSAILEQVREDVLEACRVHGEPDLVEKVFQCLALQFAPELAAGIVETPDAGKSHQR